MPFKWEPVSNETFDVQEYQFQITLRQRWNDQRLSFRRKLPLSHQGEKTEKLWQVFKHSFVAPAVNNGKLPPGSSVKKSVLENLKMGTKCDFRQNPIPHYDGCQQSLDARHIFQVLTKHFWFWKRNKHFNQEWEDGKVSQNTCSKPLCPCFSERRRPLQVFPSTSGFSDLWKKNSVAVFGSPWRWPNNKNDNNNENDKMKKL